jgi:nitroimidazol reductase NimA-like FMN-containing flavoprotein (pyridoxamine 5'-phosphate oxidase superfamily)
MLGELTDTEIDALLRRQRIGRIGSTSVGHVEITPIVYGYDGESVYGHSRYGRKVQYMRGNAEVCFEVEDIVDPTSWQVVVLWGHYQELRDELERNRALGQISRQAGGGPDSEATQVHEAANLVVYRIHITHRSGRFEQAGD